MPSIRQLFLQHVGQTTDFPMMLEVKSAQGSIIEDIDGKKYIDLISGIGVSGLGHSHPKIVKAVQDQAALYMHTMVYGEHVQNPQVNYAALLADYLPDRLDNIYFVNSGSEATEGAMKLAKRYTGRYKFIAFEDAYHGSTHGALSLMSDSYYGQAYRPLVPGVSFLPFGKKDMLHQITEQHAAVFLETVRGEAGIEVPDPNFIQAVRKRCDETGTLLVLDEIQCGMGRTGKLFAFEHFGIEPDILLLAKGFGAGMPLGAFVSSSEIMNVLRDNPILGHITTFGGHPISCAAGYAGLQLLMEEGLIEGVAKKAELFKSLLVHDEIKEIRNCGLMMAIQLTSFEQVNQVMKECLLNGVMIDWFLFNDNSMRIAPPLSITEEEIKKACNVLLQALDKVDNFA